MSTWFLYSVAINFGSSPGLLGQLLAAVAAHKPGELPKLMSTEYRTQPDVSPCTWMNQNEQDFCLGLNIWSIWTGWIVYMNSHLPTGLECTFCEPIRSQHHLSSRPYVHFFPSIAWGQPQLMVPRLVSLASGQYLPSYTFLVRPQASRQTTPHSPDYVRARTYSHLWTKVLLQLSSTFNYRVE